MPARRASARAATLKSSRDAAGDDVLSRLLPDEDEEEDDDDDDADSKLSSRKNKKGSKRVSRGNADFEPDDDAGEASDDLPEVVSISDDEDDDGAYRDRPLRGTRRAPVAPVRERARPARTQKNINYNDIENREFPEPASESSSSSEEEESSHEEVADNTGYKLTAEEKNACITCKNSVPKSKRARCSNCKRAQHLRCCKQKSPNNPKFVCQYCTSYQCDVCNKFEDDPKARKAMVQCSKCVARYHPGCYFEQGRAPEVRVSRFLFRLRL
jgi:hypothetical protein